MECAFLVLEEGVTSPTMANDAPSQNLVKCISEKAKQQKGCEEFWRVRKDEEEFINVCIGVAGRDVMGSQGVL